MQSIPSFVLYPPASCSPTVAPTPAPVQLCKLSHGARRRRRHSVFGPDTLSRPDCSLSPSPLQASAKSFYVQQLKDEDEETAGSGISSTRVRQTSPRSRVTYTVQEDAGELVEDIATPSPGAKTLKINIDLLLVRMECLELAACRGHWPDLCALCGREMPSLASNSTTVRWV